MSKISIIVPTFNPSGLLINCLKSIYKQKINKKFFEIILIDDNSNNNFYKKYKKIIDKHTIYLKNNKNRGPGISRNIGIKKSTGTHIIFLDSDDYLSLGSLKKLINKISKNKSDIYFYNYCIINNKIKKYFNTKNKYINSRNKNLNLLLTASLDSSAIYAVYDKEFLKKNNIFFQSGIHEDILFMFKVFFYLKKKYFISEYIYIKNNYKKSIINTISKKRIIDYFKAYLSITRFITKNTNINNQKNFQSKIYKGQSGYCYEMLIFVFLNISNKNSAMYFLNIIYTYTNKLFKVDKMPKKTYKDKVVNLFFKNYHKIGDSIKYNKFKQKILNIEK